MERADNSSGKVGEELARYWLEDKGWQFLGANWACKLGEIDLIMQDGSMRVFVEVRTRRRTSFGEGLDTIGWQKQRKLMRAAQAYQQAMDYWGDVRFDVISIELSPGEEPIFTHIQDAF
jgi:putative endonuclease